MSTTCTFDFNPATETWDDDTPMCEDCYNESMSDLFCDVCQDLTGQVKMGNVNAFMICTECGNEWM